MPALSRRFFRALFFCFWILSLTLPSSAKANSFGLIDASAAIIYDSVSDSVLYEQNADVRIAPASLTKVLSLFLAEDKLRAGVIKNTSLVRISKTAARTGGSRMGLRTGELVALEKLLLGMAISSGNDASQAVAEYVAGSMQGFVAMMNSKARVLGMRNSNFTNPHGLPDPGQYSTARDLLLLARAYLKAHPQALRLHNSRVLRHRGLTTWNKNPLLGQYPGADGLKTGWVRSSGHNLIFTASKGGRRLIGVILGAPDAETRGQEASRLLDAAFLACEGSIKSVTAVLDSGLLAERRIDVRKTARDAGLLAHAGKAHKYGRVRLAKAVRADPPLKKNIVVKNAKKRPGKSVQVPRKRYAPNRQAAHQGKSRERAKQG